MHHIYINIYSCPNYDLNHSLVRRTVLGVLLPRAARRRTAFVRYRAGRSATPATPARAQHLRGHLRIQPRCGICKFKRKSFRSTLQSGVPFNCRAYRCASLLRADHGRPPRTSPVRRCVAPFDRYRCRRPRTDGAAVSRGIACGSRDATLSSSRRAICRTFT